MREEDDGEAGTVLVRIAEPAGAAPPAAASWAARAGTIATLGAAVKAPARGAAVPPLWRRARAGAEAVGRGTRPRGAEPREFEAEEEEEALELLGLQARRLHPRASRGATQRLRLARRQR
mmetsp:Transcript_19451/g.53434  ORF Transcript_19451/g.53434 Transcript_19451/m.53434 type:complete len:120 (-) Transcript_19451:148-507(-)